MLIGLTEMLQDVDWHVFCVKVNLGKAIPLPRRQGKCVTCEVPNGLGTQHSGKQGKLNIDIYSYCRIVIYMI